MPAGGFLCEEMGLGKTIEVLALTLAAPPGPAVVSGKILPGGKIESRATLVVRCVGWGRRRGRAAAAAASSGVARLPCVRFRGGAPQRSHPLARCAPCRLWASGAPRQRPSCRAARFACTSECRRGQPGGQGGRPPLLFTSARPRRCGPIQPFSPPSHHPKHHTPPSPHPLPQTGTGAATAARTPTSWRSLTWWSRPTRRCRWGWL
jgi:hypothetical protein